MFFPVTTCSPWSGLICRLFGNREEPSAGNLFGFVCEAVASPLQGLEADSQLCCTQHTLPTLPGPPLSRSGPCVSPGLLHPGVPPIPVPPCVASHLSPAREGARGPRPALHTACGGKTLPDLVVVASCADRDLRRMPMPLDLQL